ncbi:MAG: hypothetical protein JWO60_2837, partial [Frankiales bacterium]|nr:hypothetical protein [Frankiales bacterium]
MTQPDPGTDRAAAAEPAEPAEPTGPARELGAPDAVPADA